MEIFASTDLFFASGSAHPPPVPEHSNLAWKKGTLFAISVIIRRKWLICSGSVPK